MRPKKTILYVDSDEQALSVRTFVLETRGYRVLAVHSCKRASAILGAALPGELDLILCAREMAGLIMLLRRARALHPEMCSVVVSRTVGGDGDNLCADAFLPKAAASVPAEVLERIRVLLVRKRGPKKLHPVFDRMVA